jgi:hypothetical protein
MDLRTDLTVLIDKYGADEVAAALTELLDAKAAAELEQAAAFQAASSGGTPFTSPPQGSVVWTGQP